MRGVFATKRSGWSALLASVLASSSVHADEPPASITTVYSPYELDAVHAAERSLGSASDPAPEGKLIERIVAIRLDPVEPRDPAPLVIDILHTTTKEGVILREVLVHPGDRWSGVVVDESARNLRSLEQLSLVLCVALRASTPDRVLLVVITKDVWSLYPDFAFSVTSGGLESLTLEPKEKNLFGRRQILSGRMILQPRSLSLGAAYLEPRLEGRWLSLNVEGNVILSRATGAPEGSFGEVNIARPLYSMRTEWAWSTGVSWRDEVYRRYSNAQVASFDERIPWIYRSRRIDQRATLTRSFGWSRKQDFTVAVAASHTVFRVPDATSYEPVLVEAFVRAAVPTGETRVGPFVEWRAYANDFLRILDFETLGLQEDYRVGHDVGVRASPVISALGSSRNLASVRAGASYTVALGDGLARASVESVAEAEVDRVSDASIAGGLRVVSPRTGAGRLVFDVTALDRPRNYLNVRSFVGGEDRLRGYPTRYFVGRNMLAMNFEFRSRPLELFSSQLGAVAFYDVARAFESFGHLAPGHAVGVGLRLVLPQIERLVIRGDVGFPVGAVPSDVAPASFFVTFGQAFRY